MKKMKILEIGTGADAKNYPLISKNSNIEITHFDYDKNAKHLELQGDAHVLPFKDNSFDVIYCSHVLEHCTNPLQVIKEMHRVTKNKAILKVPNLRSTIHGKECVNHIFSWNLSTLNSIVKKVFPKTNVEETQLIRPTNHKIKRIFLFYIAMIIRMFTAPNELTVVATKF